MYQSKQYNTNGKKHNSSKNSYHFHNKINIILLNKNQVIKILVIPQS